MSLQPYVLQEASVVFYVRACCLIEFASRFFPKKVWDEAQIKFASEENDENSSSSFHMDVICGCLSSLKLGNGTHKFGRISDVAKTLLFYHIQIPVKREFFSLIRKNKTAFRPLSRWMVLWPLCLLSKWPTKSSFEPPAALLARVKKATWNYNKEHQ